MQLFAEHYSKILSPQVFMHTQRYSIIVKNQDFLIFLYGKSYKWPTPHFIIAYRDGLLLHKKLRCRAHPPKRYMEN